MRQSEALESTHRGPFEIPCLQKKNLKMSQSSLKKNRYRTLFQKTPIIIRNFYSANCRVQILGHLLTWMSFFPTLTSSFSETLDSFQEMWPGTMPLFPTGNPFTEFECLFGEKCESQSHSRTQSIYKPFVHSNYITLFAKEKLGWLISAPIFYSEAGLPYMFRPNIHGGSI